MSMRVFLICNAAMTGDQRQVCGRIMAHDAEHARKQAGRFWPNVREFHVSPLDKSPNIAATMGGKA